MPIDPDFLYDFPATQLTGLKKTKAYELVNSGKLRITKVGTRSKITGAEIMKLRSSYPTLGGSQGQPDNGEA